MPLVLNNAETERPKEFLWNPLCPDESNEMMESIRSHMARGFKGYVDQKNGMAVLTPPELNPEMFMFRVLTENGDDRLVWDRRDLEQIEEARKTFNDYIKKGYRAYVVRRCGGEKGSQVDSFDALYEEVVMVKGKDALMVPPTVPG